MTLDHMEDNAPVDDPGGPRYVLMPAWVLFDIVLLAFSVGAVGGMLVMYWTYGR